ncbi:MAG: M28 family peptidase [Planctomycetota bacterium]
MVYAGDTKDLRDLEADIEGKWVLTSGRRPSGSVQRDLFGRGAVGILVLPEDDAEVSVAEAQGKFFERMKDPRPGKTPEAGQPGLLFLTEQSAGHFKPLIKDAKPGDLIDVTVSERCAIVSDPIMLENVVGIWPGSDPKLRNDVIVLSAHYDHVGMQGGQIHNGADDNGSGSTGMLALVEALANYGPMRRTIMIQWVSGEEKGLWGSKAWTENRGFPKACKSSAM